MHTHRYTDKFVNTNSTADSFVITTPNTDNPYATSMSELQTLNLTAGEKPACKVPIDKHILLH